MIYEGEIGHQFSATFTLDGAVVNLSGATVTLRLELPDGTTADHTAATTGSPGEAAYSTAVGDLTPAGRWRRQWIVQLSGGSIHFSTITDFVVKEAL